MKGKSNQSHTLKIKVTDDSIFRERSDDQNVDDASEASVNGAMGKPQSSGDRVPLAGEDQPLDDEEERDRKKKAAHCVHERKRKDKIKIGIQKIGQLLPASYRGEKESATYLLEQASVYIKDLQQQTERLLLQDASEAKAEEIQRLRDENSELRQEINKLNEKLKCKDLTTGGWLKSKHSSDASSDASAVSEISPQSSSNSRRKNLVRKHLEGKATSQASSSVNGGIAPPPPPLYLGGNPLGLPSDGGNGGMSFMNQLLLSPTGYGGMVGEMNSSGSVTEETDMHNKTVGGSEDGDTGIEMDNESPGTPDSGFPNPTAVPATSTTATTLATTSTQATLQQNISNTLTVSTTTPNVTQLVGGSLPGPIGLNAMQPTGLPPRGITFPQPTVAGPVPSNGQLQGTLVLHNGQLLLLNPQLQNGGNPGNVLRPGVPQDKSGAAIKPTTGINFGVAPRLATATGGSVSGTDTLLTTAPLPMVSQAGSVQLGPQPNALIGSQPGINLNALNISGLRPQGPVGDGVMPTPQAGQPPATAVGQNQTVTVNTPQGTVQMNMTPSQPNQLPSALILPNGQIVPVVTQPNFLQMPAQPVSTGLLSTTSQTRLPLFTQPAMVNSPLGLNLAQQQALRMNSGILTTNVSQPGLQTMPSGPTVRLFASGQPNTVHHVPSSNAPPAVLGPRMAPGIIPPVAGPRPTAVAGVAPVVPQAGVGPGARPLLVPPQAAAITNSLLTTGTTTVASSVTKPLDTAASSNPPAVASSNLPATVAAMLTPEGNIILTFPGTNNAQLTASQPNKSLGAANKKGGPRTLMPKPAGSAASSESTSNTPTSSTTDTTSSTKAKTTTSSDTTTVATASSSAMTPLSISITSTTGAGPHSSTDILAKAAESIFAAGSPNEISPSISSFYNPAHDDNPLHIDTSVSNEDQTTQQAPSTDSQAMLPPVEIPKPKGKSRSRSRSKSKKKGKTETDTTKVHNESFSQLSVDGTDISAQSSESSFLDQLEDVEKMDEDVESDITDFSDLIKMHVPSPMPDTQNKAKAKGNETQKMPEQEQLAQTPIMQPVVSSVSSSAELCIQGQPTVVTTAVPETSSSHLSNWSGAHTVTTTSTLPSYLPMPFVPLTTHNDSNVSMQMSAATVQTGLTEASPAWAPSTTVISTTVFPPLNNSNVPPVQCSTPKLTSTEDLSSSLNTSTDTETHSSGKKNKSKKKDKKDKDKSKKERKKERKEKKAREKAENAEKQRTAGFHSLDALTAELCGLPKPSDPGQNIDLSNANSLPPVLQAEPGFPDTQSNKESKSKSKKSKSKSKDKESKKSKNKKKHAEPPEIEPLVPVEAGNMSAELDSSTDSNREQVLMEIQNELAAKVSKEISQPPQTDKPSEGESTPREKKSRKSSKPKKKGNKNEDEPAFEMPQLEPMTTLPSAAANKDVEEQVEETLKEMEAAASHLDTSTEMVQESMKKKSNKKSKMRPEDVIPERITFSENDLADVLNQVESFGETLQSKTSSSKRPRKSKSGDDGAPPSKKKKKGTSEDPKASLQYEVADIIEGTPYSSNETEHRVRNEPPPRALASQDTPLKANAMDVFAFDEEDEVDKSREELVSPLSKNRKRSKSAKSTTETPEKLKTQKKETSRSRSKTTTVSAPPPPPTTPLSSPSSTITSPHSLKITSPEDSTKVNKTPAKTQKPKSPEQPTVQIPSPPPLITDHTQPGDTSPSQISPTKNLFEPLPNLLTPSVPMTLDEHDRPMRDDMELTTPSKSTSNDNAMNEAIDSLCRILPSPGKEKEMMESDNRSKTSSVPIEIEEPPTPGQARHTNIVSLARHVAPPKLHKSGSSASLLDSTGASPRKNILAGDRSKSGPNKAPPKPSPLVEQERKDKENEMQSKADHSQKQTNQLPPHIAEAPALHHRSPEKPPEAPRKVNEVTSNANTSHDNTGISPQKTSSNSMPSTADLVPNFTSPYSTDILLSPGKKVAEKSPRNDNSHGVKSSKQQDAHSNSNSQRYPSGEPARLQHENFSSSCMAQSRTASLQQQQGKDFYSPPALNPSAASCAVQGAKDHTDAFPFPPGFPLPGPHTSMHGSMQPFSLPVTTSTNTFSFSLSGSHSTTTTTSASSGYDQHLRHPYAGGLGMYPGAGGPNSGGMGQQSQVPPPQSQASAQHMPPALGFPSMDMEGAASTKNSSCAASGNMRQRRDSHTGSDKHLSHSSQGSQQQQPPQQQTSPYQPFMGPNSSQKTPTMATQNPYQESQQALNMSRPAEKDSCTSGYMGSGSQAQNRHSSNTPSGPASRGSASSVGRSPQPQMQQKDSNQFLSPNPGYQNSASAMSSTLTSPPLHHHGPAPSSHRSSSAQRSNFNSHYGAANPHFDPISAFGAQAFDPPPQALIHQQFAGGGSASSSGSARDRGQPSSQGHNQGYSSSSMGGGGSGGSGQKHSSGTSSAKSMNTMQSSKQGSQHSQQQTQQTKSSSSSRSSKSKKSKQQQQQQHHASSVVQGSSYEMEHNVFDPSRSMTPYFSLGGLSPPPRNLQADGPTYIPNIFNNTHGRTLSNTNTLQHKDHQMGNPFMFPHSRAQNGIGLNFQAGFGMNHMHGTHTTSSQLTGHSNSVSVTPHMPNFNLSNIFSDMNNPSQGDGLNISPIKFPHGNGLLGPQAGMEHNLQHSHQAAGAMYHNPRAPQMPPPMLHNPIFPHQHPGFEVPRGPSISSTMTAPFGGHPHTPFSGMPTLNFPMHEH